MLSHVLPNPDVSTVSNSHLANNILLCCNFIAKACISSTICIKHSDLFINYLIMPKWFVIILVECLRLTVLFLDHFLQRKKKLIYKNLKSSLFFFYLIRLFCSSWISVDLVEVEHLQIGGFFRLKFSCTFWSGVIIILILSIFKAK